VRRPEHKRFIGDQAVCAGLLPAARKLAKRLRSRLSLAPFAVLTDWIKGGGAIALVRVAAHEDHITIWAEGGYVEYEFFSSEAISEEFLGTPPFVGSLETYVCGKGSTHQLGKRSKHIPLVAMCNDCDSPEGLPVFACDNVAGEQLMRTPLHWQNQRLYEHIWWPGNNGATFVTSASGAAPGYIAVGRMGRANSRFRNNKEQYIEDAGWDLRPSLYSAKEKTSAHIATGAPNLSEPNWWRHAAVREVEGVTIFIMADAQGTFHFWPAGDYGIHVPNDLVVSVIPNYPFWCIPYSLGLWNFNSDASRAVCCPFENSLSEPAKGGWQPFKDPFGGWVTVDTTYPGAVPAEENAPGLIEVQIEIELGIGGVPVPVVTVIRQDRFSQSGRYVFAADYLVSGAHPLYAKDQLVVARFDLRIQDGNLFRFSSTGTYYPDDTYTRVRSSMVIEAVSGTEYIELHRVLLHHGMGVRFREQVGGFTYNQDEPGEVTVNGLISEFILDSVMFVYLAKIVALNLRTLSWALTHQYGGVGVSVAAAAQSVVAYGEEVLFDHVGNTPRENWPMWDDGTLDDYPVAPTFAWGFWSSCQKEVTPLSPLGGFSWHPKGHWAITTRPFPNPDLVPAFYARSINVDMVCYRRNGAPVYTTHKALYNAAFDASRDYEFYLNNPDGRRGTFRTAGVWRAW
jgi:hypothetical protein